MTKEYTYRFKCWAAAIGKPVESALERDDEGTALNLYKFSLWIQQCWSEWLKLNGLRWDYPLCDKDHQLFDAWLGQRVGLKTQ